MLAKTSIESDIEDMIKLLTNMVESTASKYNNPKDSGFIELSSAVMHLEQAKYNIGKANVKIKKQSISDGGH